MITQELLNYINSQLQQGVDVTQIRQNLINIGWTQADIDTAFNSRTPAPVATPPPPTQVISKTDAVESVKRMGKFRASWTLFKQSLNLLKQDKEVVLFPVLSSIVLLIDSPKDRPSETSIVG